MYHVHRPHCWMDGSLLCFVVTLSVRLACSAGEKWADWLNSAESLECVCGGVPFLSLDGKCSLCVLYILYLLLWCLFHTRCVVSFVPRAPLGVGCGEIRMERYTLQISTILMHTTFLSPISLYFPVLFFLHKHLTSWHQTRTQFLLSPVQCSATLLFTSQTI